MGVDGNVVENRSVAVGVGGIWDERYVVRREGVNNRRESWRGGGVVEVSSNNRKREMVEESVEVIVEERRVWGVVEVDEVKRGFVVRDGGNKNVWV